MEENINPIKRKLSKSSKRNQGEVMSKGKKRKSAVIPELKSEIKK